MHCRLCDAWSLGTCRRYPLDVGASADDRQRARTRRAPAACRARCSTSHWQTGEVIERALTIDRLADALAARGYEVLFDRQSLPTLEDWRRELLVLIRKADTVVFK
jgi:hypothetical protein